MICFTQKYWKSSKFPKEMFHDSINSNPGRQGLQFHSKILLRSVCTDSMQYGWCYAGSHNFSPSAWGRLQKNESQLHIANYELVYS